MWQNLGKVSISCVEAEEMLLVEAGRSSFTDGSALTMDCFVALAPLHLMLSLDSATLRTFNFKLLEAIGWILGGFGTSTSLLSISTTTSYVTNSH